MGVPLWRNTDATAGLIIIQKKHIGVALFENWYLLSPMELYTMLYDLHLKRKTKFSVYIEHKN